MMTFNKSIESKSIREADGIDLKQCFQTTDQQAILNVEHNVHTALLHITKLNISHFEHLGRKEGLERHESIYITI